MLLPLYQANVVEVSKNATVDELKRLMQRLRSVVIDADRLGYTLQEIILLDNEAL